MTLQLQTDPIVRTIVEQIVNDLGRLQLESLPIEAVGRRVCERPSVSL
jgi:hypothetical protein